jgi:hypothetical protein
MTWIDASNNPNLVILSGPFVITDSSDARPIITIGAVTPIGNIQDSISNPLSNPFVKTIESGNPVDAGGSVRPTSGLAYPRRV